MPLLPLKTQVNETTGLWAPASSGGGGGGGGPNLVCSSIVINDGVMTTNSSATGFVFQNSTTPVIQDAFLQASSNLPMAVGPGTANIFLLNSASGSANTITLGAGNDNASYIWTGGGGTQDGSQALYIQAAGVYMSSLTVSSINGAVPGGGGGPTVSTFTDLTVSNPTALGATLNLRASDTNLYEITTVSSSVGLAGMSVGLVGGRNQVYMDTAEAPNFYTSTIKGSTGQISLNPSGTEQIRIGGVGAPGDITIATVGGGNINLQGPVIQTSGQMSVPGSASISSLTVSSINGAAPGGGGGITRTTVNTNGSGDILGDGTLTPITGSFATTAGHLYSLEGFVYAAGSPNISSNASLEFEIGNIDRAYQGAFPMWGYSGAGGLVFGNNLPVSLTWRANTGAVNNLLQAKMSDPLGTAVSTTINASNSLMLIDYGPVA